VEPAVPEAGLEPACPEGQSLLRRSCQPIAPLGHRLSMRSDLAGRVAECGPRQEVAMVEALAKAGLNHCEIARRTSIPRRTIRDWLNGRTPQLDRARGACPVCRGQPETLPRPEYPYLLGLYLGDGHIAAHRRGVYRLRITCTNAYPGLMGECDDAMAAVLPSRVGRVQRGGCTDVTAYSRHWPCLFRSMGRASSTTGGSSSRPGSRSSSTPTRGHCYEGSSTRTAAGA
jgi:hypothetical protein